jgi:YHS domain-containing protein
MGELIAVLFRGLIFLFLFLLVRSLFRSVLAGFRSVANPHPPSRRPPPVEAAGELKKDPVCGTYVSAAASITRRVNGVTMYFCSPECRDRYQAG